VRPEWYEPARYPWRRRPTPYRVLVSEVMLQQTQASRVAPAFERFIRRFPSLRALARAARADVIRAWAGLGHNRRAVGLHEAARAVVRDHGGRIPSDLEALQCLPGIGPYTAAAVAALAFGSPVPALDVNVGRVVSRHRLGTDTAAPEEVRTAAERWLDRRDPAGWNQALMDLGRDVCRPRPRCGSCPLSAGCRFRRAGAAPAERTSRRDRFAGSSREARGRLVSLLRERSSARLSTLCSAAAMDPERVTRAVRALHRDGVVRAGPAALAGNPSGRVRLA
jgi:A/G-specific adenine glycosylase